MLIFKLVDASLKPNYCYVVFLMAIIFSLTFFVYLNIYIFNSYNLIFSIYFVFQFYLLLFFYKNNYIHILLLFNLEFRTNRSIEYLNIIFISINFICI